MTSRFMLAMLLVHMGLLSPLRADPPPARDRFAGRVAPILDRHCLKCHGTKARGGLDLSTQPRALAGADGSPVLVPGRPAQSLLIQVLDKDAEPHMPPRGQLSRAEVSALEDWIRNLPADTVVGSPRKQTSDHWAFQPVRRSPVPKVRGSAWLRTPIDAFVLAKLEQSGLSPSPEADRATLIRRLFSDLLGLPPSPEQVSAFVESPAPDAYERLVEELLSSPHYGERWGRHWLDLARYADSSGFHQDFDRPNAWRYRDYVIDSLNRDKPYGRFVEEQLAGDLLPDATAESWIATGFGRNGPSNEDNMGMGLAREKYRYDQLDDVVSTTGNVFLGLTIGCARCHDHKYDPLTQLDYYRFLAYFNGTTPRRLILNPFRADKPTLRPSVTKPDKWTPVSARVRTDRGQKPRETRVLWRGDVRNQGPIVQPHIPGVLRSEGMRNEPRSRLTLARWIADADNPLTWRVMANRVWMHHFGRGLVATPSNFGKLGEPPTHPALLDRLATELAESGGSLKKLHRLIVTSTTYRQASTVSPGDRSGPRIDPDNRLLWRMPKRRLEAEALRDSILTVSGQLNRGRGGPGVKPRIRPELLVASQRNKWPVVKKEGPEHWRRSVYVYVKRQLQLPLLDLFGAPTATHSCARRTESLVPTQSLVLMNDEFVIEQARYFAERVIREAGEELRDQVERALWIALGRKPAERRVEEAVAFVEKQTERLRREGCPPEEGHRNALADLCQVVLNLSEFVYLD